jgi:hypothetical protein
MAPKRASWQVVTSLSLAESARHGKVAACEAVIAQRDDVAQRPATVTFGSIIALR